MKYSELNTRKKVLLTLIGRTQPQANNGDGCEYDHKVFGGCAIGCLISKSHSLRLPSNCDVSGIFDELPMRLQNLGEDFLQDIQEIHDINLNWNDSKTGKTENGYVWNKLGREKINKIINGYKINLKHI